MRYVSPQDEAQDIGVLAKPAKYLTGDYTVSAADSGCLLLFDSASAVMLNFPASLPDGVNVKVWQFGNGSVVFSAPGRAIRSNATRIQTLFKSDVANVFCTSSGAVLALAFEEVNPSQYVSNNAALSSATATLANWAYSQQPIYLEPNSVYDLDYKVTFQSTATTQALKMGLSNLSSDTLLQLEGRVGQTNAPGTATKRFQDVFAPTGINVSGASSVASVNILSSLTGRILTGTTGQFIYPSISGIGTTGTISVAIGGATLAVKKVGGAPTAAAALGPEMITDLGVAPWVKTTGVTASGNNMQATNGANMLYHLTLLTTGQTYKVVLPMTFTAGAQVRINTASPGATDPGVINWNCVNGTLEGTFTATGTAFSFEARNATFTGSISGMSLKQVL